MVFGYKYAFSIVYTGHWKWCRSRQSTRVFSSGPNQTVCGSNDSSRHMAILHASLHASQQVLIQTHPLSAPPSHRPLRIWSFIQPSSGRPYIGYSWWRLVFPDLWYVAKNFHLLILFRHDQDSGRPLRSLTYWELVSYGVQEKIGLQRCA